MQVVSNRQHRMTIQISPWCLNVLKLLQCYLCFTHQVSSLFIVHVPNFRKTDSFIRPAQAKASWPWPAATRDFDLVLYFPASNFQDIILNLFGRAARLRLIIFFLQINVCILAYVYYCSRIVCVGFSEILKKSNLFRSLTDTEAAPMAIIKICLENDVTVGGLTPTWNLTSCVEMDVLCIKSHTCNASS